MNKIILGDSTQKLKELDSNSVDAIVTDPPYGLSFMGKKWDYDVPTVEMWKEALRVLKPGGHLLSFAGTRTYHRMAVNIEDAGFEIRDQIQWLYGSGFPKSLNIGKQIDKMNGRPEPTTEFKEYLRENIKKSGKTIAEMNTLCGFNGQMFGHFIGNSQVSYPTKETWFKIKDILNLDNKYDKLIDWAEAKREVIGKGESGTTAIWQDGGMGDFNITKAKTPEAQEWEGWGTALKPANEPIVVARKPLSTFALIQFCIIINLTH